MYSIQVALHSRDDLGFIGGDQIGFPKDSGVIYSLQTLNEFKAVGIYLLSPSDTRINIQTAEPIGTLTRENTHVTLPYPLGSQNLRTSRTVKIAALFLKNQEIEIVKQKMTQKAGQSHREKSESVIPLATPTVTPGLHEVVVCFGELQPFRLQGNDTFEELLSRSSKRWNLQEDNYELQDENFRSLELKLKVLETIEKLGVKVIRLVQKTGQVIMVSHCSSSCLWSILFTTIWTTTSSNSSDYLESKVWSINWEWEVFCVL